MKTIGKFPVPVEVVPFALNVVKKTLSSSFGDELRLEVRKARGKLGPLLTDNGNAIIDCYFDKGIPHQIG